MCFVCLYVLDNDTNCDIGSCPWQGVDKIPTASLKVVFLEKWGIIIKELLIHNVGGILTDYSAAILAAILDISLIDFYCAN